MGLTSLAFVDDAFLVWVIGITTWCGVVLSNSNRLIGPTEHFDCMSFWVSFGDFCGL